MHLTELCCFFSTGVSVTFDLWHSPPSVWFFVFLNAVWWKLVDQVMLSVLADPGSGPGGPAQHAVSGTGRQQLPLLQPLRQLPALLLVPHGGAGRAQGQHAEEKTVSHLLPSALNVCLFGGVF